MPFNLNNFTIKLNDPPNSEIHGWGFEIKGKEELIYAKNLCKLNRAYVQPYLNKNKKLLQSLSSNFGRFYVILTIKDNQFKFGKTIHKTDSDHIPRNICVHGECSRRDKIVSTQYGH